MEGLIGHFEVFLAVESLRNLYLGQRGMYRIHFQVAMDSSHEMAIPSCLVKLKYKNNRPPPADMALEGGPGLLGDLPAQIEPCSNSFFTSPLEIRYHQQVAYLLDGCLFHIKAPAATALTSKFVVMANLLHLAVSEDPGASEVPHWEVASSCSVPVRMCSYRYAPLIYDSNHFCQVEMTIHSAIVGFSHAGPTPPSTPLAGSMSGSPEAGPSLSAVLVNSPRDASVAVKVVASFVYKLQKYVNFLLNPDSSAAHISSTGDGHAPLLSIVSPASLAPETVSLQTVLRLWRKLRKICRLSTHHVTVLLRKQWRRRFDRLRLFCIRSNKAGSLLLSSPVSDVANFQDPVFDIELPLQYWNPDRDGGLGLPPLLFYRNSTSLQNIPRFSSHVIFFVHGFQATRGDLMLWRHWFSIVVPEAELVFSTINEFRTEDSLASLGCRLASEMTDRIASCSRNTKVSIISHSLGSLICRVAVGLDILKPFLHMLHVFVNLGGPHLSCIHSHPMVKHGMRFLSFGSDSVKELLGTDRKRSLERLSTEQDYLTGLNSFNCLILVSSSQDRYVPSYSALVESPERSRSPVTIPHITIPTVKINIAFRNLRKRNLDAFLGRQAHMALVGDPSFVLVFLARFGELWRKV